MRVLTAVALALRVISHNVRYAADPPSTGEAPWRDRLPDLLSQFRYHTEYAPQSLICLQEVLDAQLVDILAGLNANGSDWTHIGVGRDDGVRAGEYSPILYRSSMWELRDFSYFWLSETPDRPSRGWDAGSIRIVTIGVFRSREHQGELVAFNTHLDNAGSVARYQSARLLVQSASAYVKGNATKTFGPLPVVLAGDMNSNTTQEAYMSLTAAGSPLLDVKDETPPDHVYGHDDTFTGFDDDGEGRLDYVFVSHEAGVKWASKAYTTLPNIFKTGSNIRFSDHRAVVADLELLL